MKRKEQSRLSSIYGGVKTGSEDMKDDKMTVHVIHDVYIRASPLTTRLHIRTRLHKGIPPVTNLTKPVCLADLSCVS